MDEDELASRQVAGLMVTLDLVDQVAPDAVEHGHGDLAAAREWLAERLLALPSDDPMVAACSLVAWSDVFDLFATGPRALYLRYLPSVADPAGLEQAQLGDLVARLHHGTPNKRGTKMLSPSHMMRAPSPCSW
jgi:hypothetical protein